MLVLTRKLGESIWINDDVRIVIQNIRGNQVRVGIAAPKDIVVHREEIYQRIHKENRQASFSESHMLQVKEVYRNLKQERTHRDVSENVSEQQREGDNNEN